MNEIIKSLFKFKLFVAAIVALVITAFLALPILAMGAETGGTPVVSPSASSVSLWVVLIPILVPIVIAILKTLAPKIPKSWLPIIAPILGALVEIFTSGTIGIGTVWGAALGSAGVGIREIVDQMRKPVS